MADEVSAEITQTQEVLKDRGEDQVNRGGSTRRSFIKTVTTLASGFIGGATAGFVSGAQGGIHDGYEMGLRAGRTLVKEKSGEPTGITHKEIIHSNQFEQIFNDGKPVEIHPTPDVPSFLLNEEYDTPIIVTKGLTKDELLEAFANPPDPKRDKNKAVTVFNNILPDGSEEETYVYEVMLPQGSKEGTVLFVDDPRWSYFVRSRSNIPMQVLHDDLRGLNHNSEVTDLSRMTFSSNEPFGPGQSVYVFATAKVPPPAAIQA